MKRTPPTKGMSLGWRVGLMTTIVVTLVMGVVSGWQSYQELKNQKEIQKELLRKSLSPLIVSLETAPDLKSVTKRLQAFHQAYIKRGHASHHLALKKADGNWLLGTTFYFPDGNQTLRTSVKISSPGLPDGWGVLTLWEDASGYRLSVARRRVSWLIHMGVTIVATLLFLYLVLRYLVTKPLAKLLNGLRWMEMGYWDETLDTAGAWELQWLGWRFQNLGRELQRTVHQLVAAERRALDRQSSAGEIADHAPPSTTEPAPLPAQSGCAGLENLRELVNDMKTRDPQSREALDFARVVWDEHSFEAQRLGDLELKAELENTALAILHPRQFEELKTRIVDLHDDRQSWFSSRTQQLQSLFEQELMPVVSIQYRIKHAAGVWRKMQHRGIQLRQVHDLFAFRIVVATESDCYWALGIVHTAFDPILGRFKDYIVTPKSNGYQSLHTSVRSDDGQIFEVQIRSTAMHQHAEKGNAAHWLYKADSASPAQGGSRWRRMLERLHLTGGAG